MSGVLGAVHSADGAAHIIFLLLVVACLIGAGVAAWRALYAVCAALVVVAIIVAVLFL